jgi:ketosteroid isomerase-like protein
MVNDTGPPADIAAIREIRAAIERSVNELDADGIGRHLAEDVAQLPAVGQAHGRAAAVKEHRRVFDSFAEVSECYTIEQIVVVGDLAVEWGTYDITFTGAATGETSQGTALPYLFAYERDGGHWQVIRMSWEPPA